MKDKKKKAKRETADVAPREFVHNLTKLVAFMKKVVPDGEGIVFYDDGKNLTLQMVASGALSVTAILPSGGNEIEPVMLTHTNFTKAYRPNAVLSGSDGKLNMKLGTWRMALAGSVESAPPEAIKVEGVVVQADVAPLKSVPTEDNYGGSTWAAFLPEGIAALCTTYSFVAISMASTVWPKKPVIMQADAIFAMVNLVDAVLTVGEDSVGVRGKFPVSAATSARVYVALAKPTTEAPLAAEIIARMPSKSGRLAVSAAELRTCVEGAKKTFEDEATNLTFILAEKGLSINLQSHQAALTELLPYVQVPKKTKDKFNINTDVLVTAFKGMRELTIGKTVAGISFDSDAVSICITDDGKIIGAIVVANSEDA